MKCISEQMDSSQEIVAIKIFVNNMNTTVTTPKQENGEQSDKLELYLLLITIKLTVFGVIKLAKILHCGYRAHKEKLKAKYRRPQPNV